MANGFSRFLSGALSFVGVAGLITSATVFPIYAPNRQWEMGIAALAALALVAIGNIDRLSHVKAGDYELHMREAQQAATQATVTLQQVRTLGTAISRMLCKTTPYAGRWGGSAPLSVSLDFNAQIVAALRALGVGADELTDMQRDLLFTATFDHANRVGDAVLRVGVQPADKFAAVQEDLSRLKNFEGRFVAPASQFRLVLKKHGVHAPEFEEAIADLEHFQKSSTLRRPEVWAREGFE